MTKVLEMMHTRKMNVLGVMLSILTTQIMKNTLNYAEMMCQYQLMDYLCNLMD
jgi:hypothetical protein